MTAYPHRMRLHGAVGVHAMRLVAGDHDEPIDVACHRYLADRRDERLPDETPIACAGCEQIAEVQP
ncbi:MAG: hypothetical protein JWO75_483 [Actinomycetia bacterium]|nr:hypothetical protein [Actinomycetes bacterium]